MYGATKAFLNSLASSVAVEAEEHGIDVCLINPSYTNSNLYANNPKLDVIKFLQNFAWTPENVADAMFACVGRRAVCDLGGYALLTSIAGRLIDFATLVAAITPFRDSMKPPEQPGRGAKKG